MIPTCTICGHPAFAPDSRCTHVPNVYYGRRLAATKGGRLPREAFLAACIQKAARMVHERLIDAPVALRVIRGWTARLGNPQASRRSIVRTRTRGRAGAIDSGPDLAGAMQSVLDLMADQHAQMADQHAAMGQSIASLMQLGKALQPTGADYQAPGQLAPYGRAGAPLNTASAALQGVIDRLQDAHDAYASALLSLQLMSNAGDLGAEFGSQYGLPGRPASMVEMGTTPDMGGPVGVPKVDAVTYVGNPLTGKDDQAVIPGMTTDPWVASAGQTPTGGFPGWGQPGTGGGKDGMGTPPTPGGYLVGASSQTLPDLASYVFAPPGRGRPDLRLFRCDPVRDRPERQRVYG